MEDKKSQYDLLIRQLDALTEGENHRIAILSNTAAALKEAFMERFFWVGFYLVENKELVLGPFQGPVACMHIGYEKGVCGTSWAKKEILVVPDVEAFPGHIACSSLSRSEIVVPVRGLSGDIVGVLDIDSRELDAFDQVDADYLSILMKKISYLWP